MESQTGDVKVLLNPSTTAAEHQGMDCRSVTVEGYCATRGQERFHVHAALTSGGCCGSISLLSICVMVLMGFYV